MGSERGGSYAQPKMAQAPQTTASARQWSAIKSTLLGGILFLLPIVLIAWLLGKALGFAARLSQPAVQAAGVDSVAGVATGTIISILALVLLSFIAGMVARTRLGQSTFSKLENSVLSLFPQWRMARGLIESFETETKSEIEVVMVPTDAGWCLAFVLEKPEGDWWTVFIPGAPQWTSGAVAFAHKDQVQPSDLTPAQAIMLMRRCGAGSSGTRALLASLQEKGAL
jgi:uncharacterized membrane protein